MLVQRSIKLEKVNESGKSTLFVSFLDRNAVMHRDILGFVLIQTMICVEMS